MPSLLETYQDTAYYDGLTIKRLEEKLAQARAVLYAVDKLWTDDAKLGFEEEMKAPSPVGVVWNQVKAALEQ